MRRVTLVVVLGIVLTLGLATPAAGQQESDIQILNGHIVDHLVVGTLHERGIDVTEGNHSRNSQSGRKSNSMLLRNANIIGAFWDFFHHDLQGRTSWHGRGDTNDPLIFPGKLK